MAKWYVEFWSHGKQGYISGIEANNGKEAIDHVKEHVIGATRFTVMHDNDNSEYIRG